MRRCLVIGLIVVLVAGCGSTPENRYYTLSVQPPSIAVPAVPRCMVGLTLAAVRLPGVNDRPQLVVRTGPQTVDIREFDRWAEPLDQMVRRILAEDLAMRLGSFNRSPTAAEPERRLFVAVDEFMAAQSGVSRLTGRWWMLDRGDDSARKVVRNFALTQPVEASQSAQVAAAMSGLLAALADEIVCN
jgi:uncharacterized lipoprotein YmbA